MCVTNSAGTARADIIFSFSRLSHFHCVGSELCSSNLYAAKSAVWNLNIVLLHLLLQTVRTRSIGNLLLPLRIHTISTPNFPTIFACIVHSFPSERFTYIYLNFEMMCEAPSFCRRSKYCPTESPFARTEKIARRPVREAGCARIFAHGGRCCYAIVTPFADLWKPDVLCATVDVPLISDSRLQSRRLCEKSRNEAPRGRTRRASKETSAPENYGGRAFIHVVDWRLGDLSVARNDSLT